MPILCARLRGRLLIAALFVVCALTGATLLVVRHIVKAEIDDQVRDNVAASVRAFESVQKLRWDQLSRTTALFAEIPTLKALMTTNDRPTIHDGSLPFLQLADCDLFLLENSKGEIMAMHSKKPGLNGADIMNDLARSVENNEDSTWWVVNDQLYWIFIRPITAHSGSHLKQLGVLVLGYQMNSMVAEELAVVADGKIVLVSGAKVIASTLSSGDQGELQHYLAQYPALLGSGTQEMNLAAEHYQVAALSLRGDWTPVKCYVFVPLRPSRNLINKLDRTILALSILFLIVATLLLSALVGTIARYREPQSLPGESP